MPKTKANLQKKQAPDLKKRHLMRQIKRKKRKIYIRTFITLILLVSVSSAVVFLTPWFNITAVEVMGNEKVASEKILETAGIAVGSNTFHVSLTDAKNQLQMLPYIKTVQLSRKLFPVRLVVEVAESRLVGYTTFAGSFIGFDEDGEAVENSASPPANALVVTGVNLLEFELGDKMKMEQSSQLELILTYIKELENAGLLADVTALDVTNMMDVKFTYQDRLKTYCADSSNLQRKLLTFKEVALNQLPPSAKGEVDLTVEGKAYYRP